MGYVLLGIGFVLVCLILFGAGLIEWFEEWIDIKTGRLEILDKWPYEDSEKRPMAEKKLTAAQKQALLKAWLVSAKSHLLFAKILQKVCGRR